jgi:hypothetical protein
LTLNTTVVAPWGAWQCSDFRVTYIQGRKVIRRDAFSVKHVTVHCRDGSALITYCGLGALDLATERNVRISDWLRRLLRGHGRTVDETLILLREQATAHLARPAAIAGVPHTFLVGAFLQRRPWAAVIVT